MQDGYNRFSLTITHIAIILQLLTIAINKIVFVECHDGHLKKKKKKNRNNFDDNDDNNYVVINFVQFLNTYEQLRLFINFFLFLFFSSCSFCFVNIEIHSESVALLSTCKDTHTQTILSMKMISGY